MILFISVNSSDRSILLSLLYNWDHRSVPKTIIYGYILGHIADNSWKWVLNLRSVSFQVYWFLRSRWHKAKATGFQRCSFFGVSVQFSSVTQSCLTLCDPMNCSTPGLPVTSPTPGVHPDSCPSSQWCHPAISSSVVPFSSFPPSLPASESFPMSQLFTWGGQSTGVSALASFLPKYTQDWSPLGWTGWISLQSKGLSRVFSNTTVQKHKFFGAQPSSQSNSHIHTWPMEKP